MKLILAAFSLFALASTPALAFDCAKAATAVEKAICASDSLRALDEDLGRAFETLRAKASAAERNALVGSQRAWLSDRDSCSSDIHPDACLAGSMKTRLGYLTGKPEAGPGATGRLTPLIRWQTSPGRAPQQLAGLVFSTPASPGERLFNTLIRKQIDEASKSISDAGPGSTAVVSTALSYASARVISAHLEVGIDAQGAAHPNSWTRNINIDLSSGRELTFADLFDTSVSGAVVASCREQVLQDKKDMGIDLATIQDAMPVFDEAFAKASHELNRWSFGAESATIVFDAYVVGSYADGSSSCSLPYAQLRPQARPGSW